MECKVRDLSIHYKEIGSGRPILMLPGSSLDHRSMVSIMEPIFSGRDGWRRIYPDLPGTGQTHAPDWMMNNDQMLDVVLEFIDSVAPEEQIAVVGVSYGGYLARGMVHRRPNQLNGVALVVPSIERDKNKTNLPQHRVIKDDPEFSAALEPDEKWLQNFLVVQNMELLMDHRTSVFPSADKTDHKFMARLAANPLFSFEVDALPEPFAAPSLFLMGRFDDLCGYREAFAILDNYPRATFAILDSAGHALCFEQKILFKTLMGEWLDRVAG
jgi:pimeloyl-ACP methyl ester carboxylesterase